MTRIRGRILVVDDNRLNRQKLSRVLKLQGHTVALAEGGRQALQVMQTEPFDLVLLDILMPGVDGYQILEVMKRGGALNNIPVIVISALDNMESVVSCIEMGAEDHLSKPFNPVLLKARIDACLSKKWLRDQEIEYLRQVALLTTAASAVEAETFTPDSLSGVAARADELGRLARVFQRMAREVYVREQRLKQQVKQLRIELDKTQQASRVAEIVETDYFRHLQAKAHEIRNAIKGIGE